ncbi:MAG: hypothetical protein ACRCWL_05760 [Aeromonas sp.]
MNRENTLLALLESKEAENAARDEWISEWCANQRAAFIRDADPIELLINISYDHEARTQQAIRDQLAGDHLELTLVLHDMIDEALKEDALGAWLNHTAALQSAMSEEQFERHQRNRSAA